MFVSEILLLRKLLLSLMVMGCIAGLFTGVLLVAYPTWLLYASRRANRWIAMRQIDRLLKQAVKLDRWVYRYHRASGVLLLAGAIFIIYFFTFRFDKSRILAGLSRTLTIPPVFTEILLDTAVLSILMGAVLASVISLFLLSSPSVLRSFEQGANQWISLSSAFKPLKIARSGIDEYVFQHVQLAGVLLLLGSLYILAMATVWMS